MSFFHFRTANAAFRAFKSAICTFRKYSFSASPSPNATRPRKWSRFSGVLVVTVTEARQVDVQRKLRAALEGAKERHHCKVEALRVDQEEP